MYIEYPNKPNVPNGYQHLPVGAASVKLTVPASSRYATARAVAHNLRFRDDGPSAANYATGGMVLKTDEFITLTSPQQLSQFQVISTTSATAGLDINYYKTV